MSYTSLSLDDLKSEEWIDAYGFDGLYQVSNLGRIKSIGRYVNNGKSERWVKEKIRKQVKCSDGRLTCPFYIENKQHSINVAALIWQSFNYKISYNPRKKCVMHKNKIPFDNRLENLQLIEISKSHTTNHNFGLLIHLVKNNEKRKQDYSMITHKTCVKCLNEKTIINFEHGRNKCIECRKIQKKQDYEKRKLNHTPLPSVK